MIFCSFSFLQLTKNLAELSEKSAASALRGIAPAGESNESLNISDDYNYLVDISISKNWRRNYLANILLAQLHLDKSNILKTLEFTGEAIEIVNVQPVTYETISMLYDAYFQTPLSALPSAQQG